MIENPQPPVPTNQVPCSCGRSPTGFCTGLHALSNEQWDARVFDEAFDQSKHTKFTCTVIENPDNPEEAILDLGNELCDQMGWKEGDKLEFVDNQDGSFVLKKHD